MGVFENLPYTNFHELNMEWLIKKVKKLEEADPATAQPQKITNLQNGEVSTIIANSCQVYKVGKIVYVNVRVKITDGSNLSSGDELITGLPEAIEETGMMFARVQHATGDVPPYIFLPATVYIDGTALCYGATQYISSAEVPSTNDFINANFVYIAKE